MPLDLTDAIAEAPLEATTVTQELLVSLLAAALVSAGLTPTLVWILRTWAAEKLRASIRHEYAERLEELKATMRAESEATLERLRADNSLQRLVHDAAAKLHGTAHSAAYERRLKAIECIWRGVLKLKQTAPSVFTVMDILAPSEYDLLLTRSDYVRLLESLSWDQTSLQLSSVSEEVEEARPFAGEYLYSCFYVYRAMTGRIAYLLTKGRDKGHISPWYEDSALRQVLRVVLTRDELTDFDSQEGMKIMRAWALIEGKILLEFEKIVSGKASAEEAYADGRRILEAARAAEHRSG